MNQPVWLAGLGASLSSNAYQTLKLLVLYINVQGDDCDFPLCGLSRELRCIVGNNILEELKLYVALEDYASFQTDSDDWSTFDSLLTESGAFPMLHRVSVEISRYAKYMGLDDVYPVMESLKEDNFPRLVESKTVEFNFIDS